MHTLTLKTDILSDKLEGDLFFQFCVQNRGLRIERTMEGNLLIAPPSPSNIGILNAEINTDLGIWNRKHKLGYVFDSSTGFTLPNGAVRSPDVSWIEKENWEAIAEADRKVFAPITPDFVIEIRSKTDSLKALKEKMKEYVLNGVRLAWLLDMKNRQTYVYTPQLKEGDDKEIIVLEEMQGFDEKLLGGEVLNDFELDASLF